MVGRFSAQSGRMSRPLTHVLSFFSVAQVFPLRQEVDSVEYFAFYWVG